MDGFTYSAQKGEDNSYKVIVTVAPDRYVSALDTTFGIMAKDVKISGFREGKAPRQVIENKLGGQLFEETLQRLLPQIAADIVEEEDYSPVTNLKYDVQKISNGNGVEFTFSFTNYPEVKLTDLSKLRVEGSEVTVEKAEIEEILQRMFRGPEENKDNKKKLVVTDKMVKELGITNVVTLSDLNSKIEKQIKEAKESDSEQELINRILDKAIKASDIPLPDALIHQEAHILIDSYMKRIQELDVDVEGFMEAQGMTPEKLHKQKEEEAKNKLSAEIFLNEIAKKYKVIPTSDDIDNQIAGIEDLEIRSQYESAQGRRHVLAILMQQNAIRVLKEEVSIVKPKPKKVKEEKD